MFFVLIGIGHLPIIGRLLGATASALWVLLYHYGCYYYYLVVLNICLLQVSEVYQTIEFAHLAKLAPFTDNFRLERIIVDAAKSLDLPV